MAKPLILPAAIAAALAFTALPALAQETAPAAETTAQAPRARAAAIRLDFGAGRSVHVMCGQTDLAACAEAVAPLVEKVASTPAVEPAKDGAKGKAKHHKKGMGWKRPGGGEGGHGMGHDRAPAEAPPAPPPAEEAAPQQ